MEDSPKNNDFADDNEEQNVDDENQNGEEEVSYIYEWVDSMQLSRPKKNISRDFNDAVLLAEILKFHFPKLVDLHNYPGASSTKQKVDNWETLNKKVLKKIGVSINRKEIEDLAGSKPNAIEALLIRIYRLIKGIPQSPSSRKKEREKERDDYHNNDHNQGPKRAQTAEEESLNLMIFEKDQEILKLKEHIEMLERDINESSEKQTKLENRLRELNEIMRNNEIEFN